MTIADLIYLHPIITLIIFLILLGIITNNVEKFTTAYKERHEAYKAIIDLTLKIMRNDISPEEWVEKVNHLLLMNCTNADYNALVVFKKASQKSPDAELFFNFINHFRKQLGINSIKKDDFIVGLFKKE